MSNKNRILLVVGAFLLVLPTITALFPGHASAATLTPRKLTLQTGGGGGRASESSAVVNHLFSFTVPTTGNVGSIKFLYCTTPNALNSCTTPAGLSTTSATLGAETGATGFTMVNTTNGSPYLTRSAASIAATTAVTYRLDGVTNPDNTTCFGGTTPQSNNCTFYVRISTYASTDTTGAQTDSGTVAASTVTQIVLTGYMPESLVFCTGGSISTTASVPDCSTATSGAVSFPDFSPTATSVTTSQMAASTNAGSGYVVTMNGATMTSGSNTITAMNASVASVVGTSQFGMNLVDNATPNVGINVAPAVNGTNYKGTPSTGYGTADNFKFTTGDQIAASDSGGAGGTDAQIFTNAYIVNVPGSQPAGTYTTTLTYICTPTF
jgi:hypothetical protein